MLLNTKRILTKVFKVLGWIVFSVLLLLIAIIAIVQLPVVQQKITQKAVSILEKKIGTKVDIESLYISFPKNIVLKGLYLEDKANDTLLYAGKFSVNTDLWALTHNEIQLNNISLENIIANVHRAEGDSAYNFSYILKALAGDSTAVPDTLEQKGWDFSIKTVELENITAHYHDLLTGNNLDLKLGAFDVTLDQFDLNNYVFGIKEINLANTRADIVQTKFPEVTVEVAKESADTMTLNLNLKQLVLKNIQTNFTQQATGQVIRLDLGESIVKANAIDLKKRVIDLDQFSLEKTFIAYQQLAGKATADNNSSTKKIQNKASGSQPSTASASGQSTPVKSKPWQVKLTKLSLADNSLQYYDFRKAHTRGAIDFDHLWITNLSAEAHKLSMDGTAMQGDLQNFSFLETSGFELKSFKTKIKVTNDSTLVKDFLLLTGNSKLQLNARVEYESLEALARNYSSAAFRADVNESHLSVRDLLYFNPTVLDSLPLRLSPETNIRLDALMSGDLNRLSIHHLELRTLADTYLKTRGTVLAVTDPKQMQMDIELNKFYTSKHDVLTLLPDTLLPDSISPPEWINLNGEFRGSMKKARFKTVLATNIGSVDLTGNMDLDSTSSTRGFEGKLAINEFDLGTLLMQPKTIGKLNLQASINSQGLTKKEMEGTAEAVVENFGYKGYTYENFKLTATIKNRILQGSAALKDKNLEFTLKGDMNSQEDVPHYNITFDLRNADFKALHLSEEPLKARGTLDVNMSTTDFKILNGDLGIRKVAIFNGKALYAVDSLLFASIDQKGRSEIKVDSDILNARFAGSINIFTLPAVLREYFDTYYSLNDSVKRSYEGPQHFNFNLKLKKTELITDILLPQLKSFVPGDIRGEFDSRAKKLNLRVDVNEIQYSTIGIKSFQIRTNSDSGALNYNIFVDQISMDSTRIDGLEFNGTVAHDSIRTNFIVLDSVDLHKYVIGGTFFSLKDEFGFTLNPKEVKLNYENWTVPQDNYIRFGGKKLVAQNVVLSNANEKIILESKPEPGSPLFIGFRQLNLEYLVSMIAQEKPLSGLLDGDINIYPDKANLQFTSNIGIKNLSVAKILWGDLKLAVEQKVQNRYDVNFGLVSDKNNIGVNGYYTAGENPEANLTANLSKFDLSVLQPLAAKQLQKLKGLLTGELRITGNPKDPAINGGISVKDVQFFSTYLNGGYTVANETISFSPTGISFDQFELVDDRHNTARLNGAILTRNYKNFRFNLDLITNNFRLLNTTKNDNKLFYGNIDASINARIRGTMINPTVDVDVSLGNGSQLTYIVPQNEATILEQQGIVKFVDRTFEKDPFMKKIRPQLADTVQSTFGGVDLTANIELNDKESLTIVIDPTTNDQLTVKGNTTLTLQMDPSGDMQLSGRYEISEGTYNLSFYKFLKREFQIEKGSTITWNGEPLNAKMDIHAIFKVETSPLELVANHGNDPNDLKQYKQQLPFWVYLNIGGEILKPEISFKLDMPESQRNAFGGNVYARLLDINTRESDLNKQVFALLILKRFISDNPLENRASAGLEGTARNSVSKILTEQLNRLSQNVRGVELSFDLKSQQDYSTGQSIGQTNLQLSASKRLMNDRLVVKIAGNVGIEGQNSSNRQATDYIGDLAVEYKLTEDGRIRITGFRNSNFDMIDGELQETGAGIIYIKDFDALNELFKANAKSTN
jgi:translocation and assembly module TamB